MTSTNDEPDEPEEFEWPCEACTFLNAIDRKTCSMCSTKRPEATEVIINEIEERKKQQNRVEEERIMKEWKSSQGVENWNIKAGCTWDEIVDHVMTFWTRELDIVQFPHVLIPIIQQFRHMNQWKFIPFEGHAQEGFVMSHDFLQCTKLNDWGTVLFGESFANAQHKYSAKQYIVEVIPSYKESTHWYHIGIALVPPTFHEHDKTANVAHSNTDGQRTAVIYEDGDLYRFDGNRNQECAFRFEWDKSTYICADFSRRRVCLYNSKFMESFADDKSVNIIDMVSYHFNERMNKDLPSPLPKAKASKWKYEWNEKWLDISVPIDIQIAFSIVNASIKIGSDSWRFG